MLAIYDARYRDRFGEERTTIQNDGKLLSMVVRNVRFQGTMFDDFEPEESTDPANLTSFTLSHNSLCACVIEADMPMPISNAAETATGLLTFSLDLGNQLPSGLLDRGHLELRLTIGEQAWVSNGKSGWFEDELLDIQRQLPDGVFMRACINCAFSDYSPCGHGLFGGLACFRDNKDGYRGVSSKADIFRVWSTLTGYVQETYLCPEFERRTPNTGYRG